jgi:ketosteroid isomerase-like protein
MPTQLEVEARAFLDQYNSAFASIDGEQIAALYHEPCITLRGDGSIHCLQSRAELSRFFQGVAETYRRDGYRTGRFSNVEVVPIGGRSALVTLDWEMQRDDASVIRQWRQSYNLVRVESGWQILASPFHVDAS